MWQNFKITYETRIVILKRSRTFFSYCNLSMFIEITGYINREQSQTRWGENKLGHTKLITGLLDCRYSTRARRKIFFFSYSLNFLSGRLYIIMSWAIFLSSIKFKKKKKTYFFRAQILLGFFLSIVHISDITFKDRQNHWPKNQFSVALNKRINIYCDCWSNTTTLVMYTSTSILHMTHCTYFFFFTKPKQKNLNCFQGSRSSSSPLLGLAINVLTRVYLINTKKTIVRKNSSAL